MTEDDTLDIPQGDVQALLRARTNASCIPCRASIAML